MASTELAFAIRAINEASKQLKEVQGDLDKAGKSGADASPKLDKAGKSTREVGDAAEHSHGPLSRLGGVLGDVSKIAGGFIIGEGIMKLPGFFKDAAEAAAEDEAASARLAQTMRTVTDETGKAGPTFAALSEQVDGLIDKGQKLAFADDEIRDSFGKLLDSTGNVTEATARLAAAQDLARGRGIPLADATKLLGKLSEENIQIFKRLGITMADNATEADVLATVQAKFGGQAKEYAKSTAGQFEQLKIRMSEVKETIGYALLPVMTTLGDVLVTKVMPMVEDLASKVQPLLSAGWDRISGPLATIAGLTWSAFTDAWSIAGPWIEKAAGYTWDALKDLGNVAWGAMKDAWAVIGPLLEAAAKLTWDGLTALAGASWDKMKEAWTSMSDALNKVPWGAAKQEAQDTSNWADAWSKLKDAVGPALDYLRPFADQILKDFKTMLPPVQQAFGDLVDSLRDLGKALEPLEPLLKPLAQVIGGILLSSIAQVLVAIDGLVIALGAVFIAVLETAAAVIKSVAVAIDIVTKAFTDWAPAVWDALTKVADRVGDFVELVVALLTSEEMRELIIQRAIAIGEGFVNGIWQGIQNSWDWFMGKVGDFFQAIENKIPDWIPHSPSPKGVEIGEGFSQGVAWGIWNELPMVQKAAQAMAAVVLASMPNIPAYVGTINGGAVSPGGVSGPNGGAPIITPEMVRSGQIPGIQGYDAQFIDGRWQYVPIAYNGGNPNDPRTGDTQANHPGQYWDGTAWRSLNVNNPFLNPNYGQANEGDFVIDVQTGRLVPRTSSAHMVTNVIPGGGGAPLQQTIILQVDGQELARVVNEQNGRAM